MSRWVEQKELIKARQRPGEGSREVTVSKVLQEQCVSPRAVTKKRGSHHSAPRPRGNPEPLGFTSSLSSLTPTVEEGGTLKSPPAVVSRDHYLFGCRTRVGAPVYGLQRGSPSGLLQGQRSWRALPSTLGGRGTCPSPFKELKKDEGRTGEWFPREERRQRSADRSEPPESRPISQTGQNGVKGVDRFSGPADEDRLFPSSFFTCFP